MAASWLAPTGRPHPSPRVAVRSIACVADPSASPASLSATTLDGSVKPVASPPAPPPPPPVVVSAPPSSVPLAFTEAGASPLQTTTLPPVVILHGLFGAGSNFGSWAKALSESCKEAGAQRRIMLVDLRNHGDSMHASDMSFDALAADVVALLDAQGIERAVLFGHSIGGKVAMATALQHAERVERLLVMDIAPITYDPAEEQWAAIEDVVRAMRAVELDAVASKRDADRQLTTAGVGSADLRAFVLTNLVRSIGASENAFRWRVNLDAITTHLGALGGWDVDGQYDGNTLFIAGGKSRFLRSSHLPAIEQSFSRFSLQTIRTADHWIHASEPDALLVIASNFLAFTGRT